MILFLISDVSFSDLKLREKESKLELKKQVFSIHKLTSFETTTKL